MQSGSAPLSTTMKYDLQPLVALTFGNHNYTLKFEDSFLISRFNLKCAISEYYALSD